MASSNRDRRDIAVAGKRPSWALSTAWSTDLARQAHILIGVAGGLIGVFALLVGPFVSFRPNRVAEGEAVTAVGGLGAEAWIALVLMLLAASAGLLRLEKSPSLWGAVRGVAVSCSLLLLLAQTGSAASAFAADQGTAARTSFGWSFYLLLFALYLLLYGISAETPSRPTRVAVGALPFVVALGLAASGALDEVGILRESALVRATFARELGRHLFYALGATFGAIVIGIPLGILAARRARVEAAAMGVLNLGQVLPALAFIGLMIPILGGLSDRLPALDSLGISGIGWAPTMVVLLIYALYPVTRNTLVAIRQLDPGVLDTAKGMGMGRRRTLWEVELPLAFPVVLAGIRIALVQSTAGAIIAAFVGGGGLGTIMFIGLEQTSIDLVLVGVIPIVALAWFFDALLRAVEQIAARGRKIDLATSAA